MTTEDIIQKLIEQTLNGTRKWEYRGDQGGDTWYTSLENDGVHFYFRPLAGRLFTCFYYTFLKMNNQQVCTSLKMLEPLHTAIKLADNRTGSQILAEAIDAFEKAYYHENVNELRTI